MKKILIIRLSSIGDVVHIIPSLYLLRQYFPDAFIGWVISEKSADIIKGHSLLDKVYILKRFPRTICKDYEILKSLKLIKWDIIIDYHFFLKSLLLRPFLYGTIYTYSYNDIYLFEEYLNYICSHKNIDCSLADNCIEKALYLTRGVINENKIIIVS